MMTSQQVEQNILTLAEDLKREIQRGDELNVKVKALEGIVAEMRTTVERLKTDVAVLNAVKRGHGPSVGE